MNELFEEVAKITDENTEFHIFKFKYSGMWTCVIERKRDGVELKINGEGATCPEAISNAVDKFLRASGGIKEFSGPLLEHIRLVPTPSEFDDSVPF